MKQSKKVMFIGAHPDDIELNAGGYAAKLVDSGWDVLFVCFAGYHSVDPQGRSKEYIKASNILGVRTVSYDFPDTKLINCLHEMISNLNDLVSRFEPELVVTHFHDDTHQDHRAVNIAVMAAARLVPNVLMFKPTYPSGRTNIAFRPNYVVRLTEDQVKRKMDAMAMYTSQAKKYGSENWFDSIRSIMAGDAWAHGGFHGSAEVFEVSRMFCP